ncbi:hypothetical protein AGR1B_Lc50028 [Agrobacterium fabacearum S56]|nr:hypothetical protein AGR1B_Lc50028 [Agrobacterium fabacearum S56]
MRITWETPSVAHYGQFGAHARSGGLIVVTNNPSACPACGWRTGCRGCGGSDSFLAGMRKAPT